MCRILVKFLETMAILFKNKKKTLQKCSKKKTISYLSKFLLVAYSEEHFTLVVLSHLEHTVPPVIGSLRVLQIVHCVIHDDQRSKDKLEQIALGSDTRQSIAEQNTNSNTEKNGKIRICENLSESSVHTFHGGGNSWSCQCRSCRHNGTHLAQICCGTSSECKPRCRWNCKQIFWVTNSLHILTHINLLFLH